MGAAWPWALAVVACMVCSFFVQSGAGAVFAIVPLVKKRVSGQIAGMAGAYGNIGGVVFLTDRSVRRQPGVLPDASPCAAVVAMIASLFLVEPAESFATELLTDHAAGRRARSAARRILIATVTPAPHLMPAHVGRASAS